MLRLLRRCSVLFSPSSPCFVSMLVHCPFLTILSIIHCTFSNFPVILCLQLRLRVMVAATRIDWVGMDSSGGRQPRTTHDSSSSGRPHDARTHWPVRPRVRVCVRSGRGSGHGGACMPAMAPPGCVCVVSPRSGEKDRHSESRVTRGGGRAECGCCSRCRTVTASEGGGGGGRERAHTHFVAAGRQGMRTLLWHHWG